MPLVADRFTSHMHSLVRDYLFDNEVEIDFYTETEPHPSLFVNAFFFVGHYTDINKFTNEIYQAYNGKQIRLSFDDGAGSHAIIKFQVDVVRFAESSVNGMYISPVTGKPLKSLSNMNISSKCVGRRTIVITPFNNCPHVKLDLSQFSWKSNATGLIIHDLDLYMDNVMFQVVEEGSVVLVCANTLLDAVNRLTKLKRTAHTGVAETEGIISFSLMCLSIVCLLLTLVTYMLFPVLRTQPGINNIVLCLILIPAYVVYMFSAPGNDTGIWCQMLGAIKHFTWLLGFFWMNVCSFHMFRVFASLSKPQSTKSKLSLTISYMSYAVLSTCVVIVINISVTYYISKGDSYGYGLSDTGICYIRYSIMVIYTMAIPDYIIVASNIAMFIFSAFRMRKATRVQRCNQKDRNFFSIYARLSTITGITWIVGVPMILVKSQIVNYIFIVLTCSQGVYVFIAFACNKRVYGLYNSLLSSRITFKSSMYETPDTVMSDSRRSHGSSTLNCKGITSARNSTASEQHIKGEQYKLENGSLNDNRAYCSDTEGEPEVFDTKL